MRLTTAGLATSLLLVAGRILCAEPDPTIYYFCAESHVDNYAVLKSAFDHFLVPRAGIRFQPVRRWKDFEGLLDSGAPAYFIMNGATFAHVGPPHKLIPALVGEWRGSRYEHFDLHISRSFSGATGNASPVIATSFTAEAAGRLITEILTDAGYTNTPNFRLLHVPKHLDALIAVRLGLADAALAARESTTATGQINEANRLRGRPYLRLVVARNETVDARPDLENLRHMHEDPEGNTALQLLRVTRFLSLPSEPEDAP